MNVFPPNRFERSLPDLFGTSPPVTFAVLLTLGLVACPPLFAWLVELAGLPVPLPLLVGVGLVGAGYLAVCLVTDELIRGTFVALVVTATFGANVPLTGGATGYPGTLGPQLWLVHAPLVAIVALFWLDERVDVGLRPFSRAEKAFGAFVAWSGVVSLVGAPVRQDTALFFTLFVFVAWLVLVVATRTVRSGVATLTETVSVLAVAAVGHTGWALVQLLNGNSLGLSYLGEGRRVWTAPLISMGPLGTVKVGAYLSGFTGGVLPLACLLLLTLPFLLSRPLARRSSAVLVAGAGLLAAVVLRGTDKTAARGALALVGLVAVVVLVAYLASVLRDGSVSDAVAGLRRHRWVALATGAVLASLAYPTAGRFRPDGSSGESGGGGAEPTGDGTSAATEALGGEVTASLPGWIPDAIASVDTLEIRLLQYVAGIDVAARRPLFGIGGGNFRYVAPAYGIPVPVGHPGPLSLHNMYLGVLVGTGVPGFALFVATLLFVFASGLRLATGLTGEHRVVVLAVLLGLVGYLANAFWDTVLLSTTAFLPVWIVLGALDGEAARTFGTADATE